MSSLSVSYRRAEMIGFWFVALALLALAAGAGSWLAGADRPHVWAAGACVAALLPGIVSAPWFETGVRAWNAVVRHSVKLLRGYVVAVCYYTLFLALGWSESRRGARPRPGSRWLPRERPELVSTTTAADGGLFATARRPGNAWMVWLAPVVFLLDVLGDDRVRSVPPGSTYTLY
jgi:hypothetical protein